MGRMLNISRLVKQMLCKHKDQQFVRNIYGDEINRISTKHIYRSEFRCKTCGKLIYHQGLVDNGH